jgi:hypothetical protein
VRRPAQVRRVGLQRLPERPKLVADVQASVSQATGEVVEDKEESLSVLTLVVCCFANLDSSLKLAYLSAPNEVRRDKGLTA